MTINFEKDLAPRLRGEVQADSLTRICYSVDASIFQQQPLAVVFPMCKEDVVETVRFAKEANIPITARGAATGITGACLGSGIVIDFSKHMKQILEVNYDDEYVIVEPGVVQDQLNRRVAEKGFRFGPDTSTGNRATVGGMYGNNSSGAHSLRYGKTIDSVLEAEVVLSDSSVAILGASDESQKDSNTSEFAAKLDSGVRELIDELRPEIERRYPKIQRNVAGYCLNEMVGETPSLAKLLCGSEGTLGLCTQLKLRIVRSPIFVGLVLFHFDDMATGLSHVPKLLEHDPFALELLDRTIIETGRSNPSYTGKLEWLQGEPDGILAFEVDADSEDELNQKIKACLDDFQDIGYARVPTKEKSVMAEVWNLRKAGLGLLLSRRSHDKAIAFIEDAAVPPECLSEFIVEFQEYLKRVGKSAAFFGHAGVGLIHIRPMLDLGKDADLDLMIKIMEDIGAIIFKHGGSVTGEHGDGMIRSWLIEECYGPEVYNGFKRVKLLFDPENIMNPGKIVDAPLPRELIRDSLKYHGKGPVETAFTFPDADGMAFSAGMCNGNAACRKMDGTMCPSFQGTGDELHSTRARATALQKALLGTNPELALTDSDLYRVMELCLQCKACSSECPSQVDIAKMKSEFLYHYQKANGIPLRNRIFANVDLAGKLASLVPGLSNFMMNSGPVKSILSSAGITDVRPPMNYASQRFTSWYKQREKIQGSGDKVALFIDTFSEFNYPEIPKAAIKVLEALDCQITVAPYSCCGRPAISKGLLDQARKKAERIRDLYLPLVKEGYTVVGLEPGCILTFCDEHPALLPGDAAQLISEASMTIEEYLFSRLEGGFMDLNWLGFDFSILVHGHCHQKAQVGTNPSIAVLSAIPGYNVEEIDSGCCGMGGTFGYETEHYDLSMQIGEQRLFPAVRNATGDTLIVASGASCRSQIEHGTQRHGLHFIEAVAAAL